MANAPKYKMTVDLSVLESLGINLYSNAAAVISELVANAYDADATDVSINWKLDDDTVTIIDNGNGMSVEELNERFLAVGYKKRSTEGGTSEKWMRPFMGRKGIGKLSVFSIANTVTVYSTKDGESNGLRILLGELEEKIRQGGDYHPEEVDVPTEYQKAGTAIVLERLKTQRASITAAALRKRLARRFDVLDETPANKGGFKIKIDGGALTFADRQELKNLEYIWEFHGTTIPKKALPKNVVRFKLSNVVDAEKGWKVAGWIGTARTPSDLTDDKDAGSLKNIIVIARKRPIQEGIIEKLDFSRIFGSYATGQVEADFLDLDDADDIATTDRQRLIEDDPRVIALQHFLREAFKAASETWSDERPQRQAKDLLDKHPSLKEWVNARPAWQKPAARKMLGTIAALSLEKKAESNRKVLFRSGILAFERIGLRETIEDLTALGDVDAETLLPLLASQDDYEAGLWSDILRSRVEAIQQFEDLTAADEKEKVLQEHLFNHLWLLDPSWERATESTQMELDLKKADPDEFATDEKGNEIRGRIDIRYRTVSGRHVIVELKRYSVNKDISELVEQGGRYLKALRSILTKKNMAINNIDVVFVLGGPPNVKDLGKFGTPDDALAHALEGINGRVFFYDELIENARQQYQAYFDASSKVRDLDKILRTFD